MKTATSIFCLIRTIATLTLLISGCAKTIPYPENTSWSTTGITELKTVKINGLRHEMLIRGTSNDNPVILFIHGFGVPTMCFAHLEYAQSGAQIERDYTVVHYDQRGFGKTFIHGKRTRKKITVDQYVNDAAEITSFVRNYLKKDKVILLCESWGCVIGMNLIQRHPEWYQAYFGLGQINNIQEFLLESYSFAISEAKKDKNEKALGELKKYGSPSVGKDNRLLFKSYIATGTWLDYYTGKKFGYNSDSGATLFFSSLWKAPEYHFYDFINTLSGYMSTQKKLIPELMAVNLQNSIQSVNIPVFFISGEWDYWLPYSEKYFSALQAPRKELFIVKNAGHQVRGDQSEIVEGYIFKKIKEQTLINNILTDSLSINSLKEFH
jgi:pimeloyl-ACP methyl ester carboxylesterase